LRTAQGVNEATRVFEPAMLTWNRKLYTVRSRSFRTFF